MLLTSRQDWQLMTIEGGPNVRHQMGKQEGLAGGDGKGGASSFLFLHLAMSMYLILSGTVRYLACLKPVMVWERSNSNATVELMTTWTV